ncbi:MAG: SynChlorMet cassette protein ScmD [candidate division KSB1 bacterium]|nr:SynChlorMet cassette protein ScmD [candidate division KSB1 bacterium]
MVTPNQKIAANSIVVLREEFDDWGLLFDPDRAAAFGVNPIGADIWKLLDGHHSIGEIIEIIKNSYSEVPNTAESEIIEFIQALIELRLAVLVENDKQ